MSAVRTAHPAAHQRADIALPGADVWGRAVASEPALLQTLDEVLQRTRGHIPSTVLLLRTLLADPGQSVGRAFDALAMTQVEHANRSLLHASALHRLGGQVITAVARGKRPVGRWEIANPFVARLLSG